MNAIQSFEARAFFPDLHPILSPSFDGQAREATRSEVSRILRMLGIWIGVGKTATATRKGLC